jgi:uncharacterized membrane protein
MRPARIIFVVLLALASAPLLAHATGSARCEERKSRIVGVVLDPNGARIPSAAVRIENAKATREAYTSDEGSFEVELPAGTYRVTVEAQGFRTVEIVSFRARADRRESLEVRMKVKPSESTLKVK